MSLISTWPVLMNLDTVRMTIKNLKKKIYAWLVIYFKQNKEILQTMKNQKLFIKFQINIRQTDFYYTFLKFEREEKKNKNENKHNKIGRFYNEPKYVKNKKLNN